MAPLPPAIPIQTNEINSAFVAEKPPTSIADVFANMTLSPQPSSIIINTISTGSRPLPLTTNEFGMRWGEASSELKKLCPCKVRGLDQLRVSMHMSFAHIESIPGSAEAIFAATSSLNSIILVHVKIEPNALGCSITVRSSTRDICENEINSISNSLSNVM
jgi:hypothetical protein